MANIAHMHPYVVRVPGAGAAVIEHEEWGERARNLFLLIAAVEVVGLAVPSKRRWFNYASGALGACGLYVIYAGSGLRIPGPRPERQRTGGCGTPRRRESNQRSIPVRPTPSSEGGGVIPAV
jgi:hypothetical protein